MLVIPEQAIVGSGEQHMALAESVEPDVELDMSDERLALASRVDRADFEALYTRYLNRVHLYLLRKLGSPEDAADITQHVFLRALANIHRFDERRGTFASWLFTIARNSANSALKRRRPGITWDALPASAQPRCDPLGDDRVIGDEALASLREALQTPDPRAQELITLRFEIGLKLREVAVAMDMNEDATRKAVQRALIKLREQLNDGPK